jgi:AcrR family transcriptional regulator
MTYGSKMLANSETGRRERKKRDTRERLLTAALALFVERGYAATSMDDIAARCDVARGTVFNYFARKEDLLLAWIETRRVVARQVLADSDPHASTSRRLRDALTALCKSHEREAPASRALVRCWLHCGGPLLERASETALMLRAVLEVGRQREDVRRDVDSDAAARALLDLYLGALYRWAADDEREPTSLTGDLWSAIAPFLRGIEAPSTAKPRRAS